MTSPAIATLPGISHHFLKGQIVDLESDKAISFEELICRFASIDLLFVGEIHDNPEHHLLQIQILQALADTSFPITLGVEFFQENQQDTLDRYLTWEFAEEEFLRELNWKREWGFDYHLYRPLILFARQNGIRILALNAPREIVRKVAREGLKTLDPEERSQIALDIDLANEAHRAYVKDAYAEHSHGDLRDFELFYEAQCVWDETMAENLAEHSWGSRELVVVFAGNGHIAYKFGIPDRTARRRPVSVATILLLPLSETTVLEKAIADYVWLTSDCRNKGERSN
jgi:uncharacterized iron-regulated protein